jgi:retron-type reverse transcriptase
MISLYSVDKYLKELGLPEEFVNYIFRINSSFPLTRIERMDPEDKEVIKLTRFADDSTITVEKSGMPQGLPWSPILSILVLDRVFKKLDLNPIMFADDGLIITDKVDKTIVERLKCSMCIETGILLSDKKKKDGKESCK